MVDAAKYVAARLAGDEDLQVKYLLAQLGAWQWSQDHDPDNTKAYWNQAVRTAEKYGLKEFMNHLLGV